jgi:hypothetical protein
MQSAASSIEAVAKTLSSMTPLSAPTRGVRPKSVLFAGEQGLSLDKGVIEAAQSVAKATSTLITAACAAQQQAQQQSGKPAGATYAAVGAMAGWGE